MSKDTQTAHHIEDDFCGAAGAMFENTGPKLPGENPDPREIYAFESKIVDRLQAILNSTGEEQASVIFDQTEALTQGFKRVLLEVLKRKKKEALRNKRVLTVSHPEMDAAEQVPFFKLRREVPMVTLRRATDEDLASMHFLRATYPELLDARNAIKSVKTDTSYPHLF